MVGLQLNCSVGAASKQVQPSATLFFYMEGEKEREGLGVYKGVFWVAEGCKRAGKPPQQRDSAATLGWVAKVAGNKLHVAYFSLVASSAGRRIQRVVVNMRNIYEERLNGWS